jgi:hypothetical protein
MWFSLAVMLVYALIVSNGVNGWELRGTVSKKDRNLLDAEDYIMEVYSPSTGGCVQAKGEGVNSEVILATWDSCTSFRIDEDGLIRSFKEGGDLCLQAGKKGSP